MNEKPPFAVQAAKASWIAPLLAITLGIAGRIVGSGDPNTDPETVRLVALVIGGICFVIVVAGLVLGVIALIGIPKHGIKGILFPAIIGTLLCFGWLFLLFSAVQAARHAAQAHARMIER